MKRLQVRIVEEGGVDAAERAEQEEEALAASLTDVIWEVIDVRTAQLLASATHRLGDVEDGSTLLPDFLFRDGMTGYVYGTAESGLRHVEIIEAVLEGK